EGVTMKRSTFLVAALLLSAVPAMAQSPTPQQATLAWSVKHHYDLIRKALTDSAAKMPEADYGFKPSTMAGVPTFGQLIAHTAAAQAARCASILGRPNPNQGHDLEKELTKKADIEKALASSFAVCDQAVDMVTDQNATDMIAQGRS